MPDNEWNSPDWALNYLAVADDFPHRAEGEGVLLDHIPRGVRRVLDVGTGDGRLLRLLAADRPEMHAVGIDLSDPMLDAAEKHFGGDDRVMLFKHDLAEPLPDLGTFDAIVSSFAIHHLEHERKAAIYGEIFDRLEPGGVFANLEHVASPSERVRLRFIQEIGETPEQADPSDRLIDVESQLVWFRDIGFEDADCYWKWLEMALLIGVKPGE